MRLARSVSPRHARRRGAWTTGVYLARLTTAAVRAAAGQPILHRLRRPRRWARSRRSCFNRARRRSRPTTTGAASRSTASTAATRRPGRSPSTVRTPPTRTACASTAPAISCAAGSTTPSAFSSAKATTSPTSRTSTRTSDRWSTPAARSALFLSVGHDESGHGRCAEHVEAARDRGVHLASSAAAPATGRSASSPARAAMRTARSSRYKEAAGDLDPLAIDGNPQNDRLITGRWRDRPAARPEEQLSASCMPPTRSTPTSSSVRRAHWVFAGTGLRNGDALRGPARQRGGRDRRRRPGDARAPGAFTVRRAGRSRRRIPGRRASPI